MPTVLRKTELSMFVRTVSLSISMRRRSLSVSKCSTTSGSAPATWMACTAPKISPIAPVRSLSPAYWHCDTSPDALHGLGDYYHAGDGINTNNVSCTLTRSKTMIAEIMNTVMPSSTRSDPACSLY